MKRCCIPGCPSNKKKGIPYTSIFSFPSDPSLLELWKRKIPLKDIKISKCSGICITHFDAQFILKEHRAKRSDGTELVLPRKRVALAKNAYPSIFPSLPKYLTSFPSPKRTDPEKRRQAFYENSDLKCGQWLANDEIKNLDDIVVGVKEGKINYKNFLIDQRENKIYFFKMNYVPTPNLEFTITLDCNFKISAFRGSVEVNLNSYSYILGKELVCNTYNKLENFLNAVHNSLLHEQQTVTFKEKMITCQHLLGECIEECDSTSTAALKFISEQLHLVISKQIRYSTDLLLFCCTFLFTFPNAYRFLREQNILKLPSPCYLKTFNLHNISGDINKPLKNYLLEKANRIKDYEKKVCLLLDEIYVKPKISYTGTNIVGAASNSNVFRAASTIQVYMIKSLLSKNKDVVALLPVKNLESKFLYEKTMEILTLLHNCGYEVVSIITDNNKINVKLFLELSGGQKLNTFIQNPCNQFKKIFLLFDTVHLIKNIRNNWLNEKNKTFIYPSFENNMLIWEANFQEIINLYEAEKTCIVKLAPSLTFKACFPNNLERQNVKLALAIFDEKLIAALDNVEIKEFISIIRRWWTIVNVKSPEKGKHLRDKYADPIRSMEQLNIIYLKKFKDWLMHWENLIVLDDIKRAGKLSNETFSALLHTTEGLINLCAYLLKESHFSYVMLGTFQTDVLERRFGKYRRMSGCNYNVSVQQIIESEKKIKINSLLKLSSNNNMKLKNIIETINSEHTEECINEDMLFLQENEEIVHQFESVDISNDTLQTLVFIAGYAGYKVTSKTNCKNCVNTFINNNEIVYDLPSRDDYFYKLNRGGLKYPSEISLNLGTSLYQIFETITSDQFESSFIKAKNHKGVLKSLLLEIIEFEEIICNTCNKSRLHLFEKLINTWINIFLNNYSKVKSSTVSQEKHDGKKRKLSIFTRI